MPIRPLAEKKVSAKITGLVILNQGFRWARSFQLRVRLTRDGHSSQKISKPELREHWLQEILSPIDIADNFIVGAAVSRLKLVVIKTLSLPA